MTISALTHHAQLPSPDAPQHMSPSLTLTSCTLSFSHISVMSSLVTTTRLSNLSLLPREIFTRYIITTAFAVSTILVYLDAPN